GLAAAILAMTARAVSQEQLLAVRHVAGLAGLRLAEEGRRGPGKREAEHAEESLGHEVPLGLHSMLAFPNEDRGVPTIRRAKAYALPGRAASPQSAGREAGDVPRRRAARGRPRAGSGSPVTSAPAPSADPRRLAPRTRRVTSA